MNSLSRALPITIAFILACFGVFAAFMIHVLYQPLRLKTPEQYEVTHALTMRAFLQDLSLRGIIQNPGAVAYASQFVKGAKQIDAGVYELKPGMTVKSLIHSVSSNGIHYYPVTIIDGWRFATLKKHLADNPYIKHDLAGLSDASIMAKIQQTAHPYGSPEGLFFPQTYYVTAGSSELMLLKRAYMAMQVQLQQAWLHREKNTILTSPYQALILASLVEAEAKQKSDMPKIAAVFLNRLRHHMRLQSDPTVLYGLDLPVGSFLSRAALRSVTPFNTYRYANLPPHPIAMPSQAAILAVLHPAHNADYYFVADGHGGHVFSRTLKQQDQARSHYAIKIHHD